MTSTERHYQIYLEVNRWPSDVHRPAAKPDTPASAQPDAPGSITTTECGPIGQPNAGAGTRPKK